MDIRKIFAVFLSTIIFGAVPAFALAQTTITSTMVNSSILQELINELQYIEQIILKLEAAATGGSSATSTPPTAPVTSTPATSTAPVIISINPSSGLVGTTVTIGGDNFGTSDNIHFGGGGFYDVTPQVAVFNCPMMLPNSTQSCGSFNQILTFTVPSSLGAYCPPGEAVACPMYEMLVTPNTYSVSVENGSGTSNAMTFTVTGTSSLPLQ